MFEIYFLEIHRQLISKIIVFASREMFKTVNMSMINVAQPRAEFGDTNMKSFFLIFRSSANILGKHLT